MPTKKTWTHVELRIPMFILAIGLSILVSEWANMMTQNIWLQQLAFPLILGLLVLAFELTKLSKKRVHAVWGIAIILSGLWIEALIEPGDYAWIRDIIL